jgi:addiction module RelE/StbE family toxin
MRVRWTPEALHQLRAIHEHISHESLAVARQVIQRLVTRSGQLAELPRSGRKVPDYGRDDLREVLVQPYRIVYRITPLQIDVITIMHYRQLLPRDWQQLGA